MDEELVHFGGCDIEFEGYDVFYMTACGQRGGITTPRGYTSILNTSTDVDEVTCNNCMETHKFRNAVNEKREEELEETKKREMKF